MMPVRMMGLRVRIPKERWVFYPAALWGDGTGEGGDRATYGGSTGSYLLR